MMHYLPEPVHPVMPFRLIHVKGLMNGVGHPFNIIGINHDSPSMQLGCSTCKLTENQHTIFFQVAGTVLFCD